MALSYYSNWGTQVLDQQQFPQEHDIFLSQEQQLLPQDLHLPPELLNFHDNFDTCIDPLFSQNNHFCYSDQNFDAYAPFSPSPLPLNTLPPLEMVEDQEEACFDHHLKTMKFQENYFCYPEMTIHSNYDNNYEMGFVPNPPLLPEFTTTVSELPLPLPLPVPPVFNVGSNDNDVKKTGGGGSLSQQSIAARLRRRKITEKTQELGKLIPGGHKMNTAEMFQAASKYIKLLQAQVGLLQLMKEEDGEEMYNPELGALVTSPLVQEKLYSAEKCLVPKNFVEKLTQKPQLHSNPQLIKDLIKLI